MKLNKKEKLFVVVDFILYIIATILYAGGNLFAHLLILVIIGSIFIKWKENNKLPLFQLILLTALLISYIFIGIAIHSGTV